MHQHSHQAMMSSVKRTSTLLLAGMLTLPWVAFAQEDAIDEDALFGDANALLVDSAQFQTDTPSSTTNSIQAKSSNHAFEQEGGIRASGGITTQLSSGFSREFFHDPSKAKDPSLLGMSVGELFLDARMTDDSKAFAAVEGVYRSDSQEASAYLRELFLDFNFSRRLYVRAGKQVLQWGRCYFWHPSDLINVEHKEVIERAGTTEGTYGVRLHAPFGTVANLYGFIDTRDAHTVRDLKATAKVEALIGPVEAALSVWKKADMDPVVALDASGKLWQWDIVTEAAMMPQGFAKGYGIRQGLGNAMDTLVSTESSAWSPRIALSAGRAFDLMEVQDRIRVQYEVYYNALGYKASEYQDTQSYHFQEAVQLENPVVIPGFGTIDSLSQGMPFMWLAANGQLQSYSIGQYYAAYFASLSRFLIQDLTLASNGILNISDKSYVLTGSLAYTTLQNLTLQLAVLSFGGAPSGEFTLSGQRMQVQMSAALVF